MICGVRAEKAVGDTLRGTSEPRLEGGYVERAGEPLQPEA